MLNLLFTCPRSGSLVQGSIPNAAIGPDTVYVPVDCPICQRPHVIDLEAGTVPQGDSKQGRKN